MAEKNYYDILGVKKNASDADIKKKYRKLVRQYHPDVSDDPEADNKIAEINNAYETIRDKDKRAISNFLFSRLRNACSRMMASARAPALRSIACTTSIWSCCARRMKLVSSDGTSPCKV